MPEKRPAAEPPALSWAHSIALAPRAVEAQPGEAVAAEAETEAGLHFPVGECAPTVVPESSLATSAVRAGAAWAR
jgi:hypothetical protein